MLSTTHGLRLCCATLLVVVASAADSRFFWQLLCVNGGCNEGCSQTSLPTNKCLEMQAGASGMAYCDYAANDLVIEQYILSANCTGAPEVVRSSLMQCYATDSGNYVEYMCPPPNSRRKEDDEEEEKRRRDRHHRGGEALALPAVGVAAQQQLPLPGAAVAKDAAQPLLVARKQQQLQRAAAVKRH